MITARSLIWFLPFVTLGAHAATGVVISQVYGGGGNSGAPLTNDFIELHNVSSAPIALDGWSVQYASATGNSWQVTNLSGTLQPGHYYLVQEAIGANTSATPLPTPEATGTIPMSATTGKVALLSSTSALTCASAATCTSTQLAQIVDIVGYGPTASFSEGSPAPVLTNSTADLRGDSGCTDTSSNASDFATGSPTPRNSAAMAFTCSGTVNLPVTPNCPASVAATVGVGTSANLSANDPDGFVASAVITSTAVSGISLNGVTPGPTLTAQLLVDSTVATGTYPVAVRFTNSDAQPQTASCSISVSVTPSAMNARIHDIQGAAHISPLNGKAVSQVPGIVTAVRSNGFNLQDPQPDSDPATSEALFVFTNTAPTVQVGDSVIVGGTVAEFRPGNDPTNLTQTEIDSPAITIVSTGNALPPPVILGAGGRAIPSGAVDASAPGNVETGGAFNPAVNAIDFYESLEGMRVQFNNAVVVGPTNKFGEIPVVADNAGAAALRSARGGLMLTPASVNPQRLILAGTLTPTPDVSVGATFASITAIVDYSFGDFKFDITAPIIAGGTQVTPETTAITGTPSRLTVGSFNVENLSPKDPATKFAALAQEIVHNVGSPDILALMEIQDNSGPTSDGVVSASNTFATLIAAIQAAGGPTYQFRSIDPVDGQDGGQPGGNIRVAFVFNPARVSFVDRTGGGATVNTTVVAGPHLSASPGRILDTNGTGAFDHSRKPLAGEFTFNGHTLFVIANHLVAKDQDDPLFGPHQPPAAVSQTQRHLQAQILNTFVSGILTQDANASVVLLGDLNDFEFSDSLSILESGGVLVDTVESLPVNERYTYVFEGNSQVLDHILLSSALNSFANPELDILHINAEFADQTSDHDPDVVRLRLPLAGDADGDGDVDNNDIGLITAARNTSANGPFDARDLNHDGRIDAVDARLAVNACTRARCAVQ